MSGECGRKAFGSFEKLAFGSGPPHRVSPGTPDGGPATRAPDGHRSTGPGAVAWRRLTWLTDTDFRHAGPSPAQTVALSAAAPNAQPENARERPDRPTSALTRRAITTRPSRPLSPDTGRTRGADMGAMDHRRSRYSVLVFGAPTLGGPRSRSSTVCLRENRRSEQLRSEVSAAVGDAELLLCRSTLEGELVSRLEQRL